VDYDRTEMPEAYDAGRGYRPEVLRLWLERVARHLPLGETRDIIDLGAGTGRYTAPLAVHFDANVVGVEPSGKMLAEARKKASDRRVSFVQGMGETLPVRDSSADLIFLSMVFHHLQDPDRVARECRRVLRPRGRVAIRNGTTEQTESFPHVRFFPGVRAVIAESLPPATRIAHVFRAAGFEVVAHEIVVHEMALNWPVLAEKWRHRADSILVRLSDTAFERGLAALARHAERADPTEAVEENVDLFIFRSPDN